jgi:hypothetical protein
MFPSQWLTWTPESNEHLKKYASQEYSSGKVERTFCGTCGTTLMAYSRDRGIDLTGMTMASLCEEDLKTMEERGMTPSLHYWWDSGIDWFQKLMNEGEGEGERLNITKSQKKTEDLS